MKGVDVSNRLKQFLPYSTNEFSNNFVISSLTRSGTTVTAITSTPHGLATGNYVTVFGAKQVIPITSLTRVGTSVNLVSTLEHGFVDPSKYGKSLRSSLTVEVIGATPSEYNGTSQLLTVTDQNNLSFEISTTPTTPASTPGTLLIRDQGQFNRYTDVVVIDTTTFTYEVGDMGGLTAGGTIGVNVSSRVGYAATTQAVESYYKTDISRAAQSWMFVVLNAKTTERDGVTATDTQTQTYRNVEYYYQSSQFFSIYVFLPCKDQLLAGPASDLARELELPILKTLANFQFSSVLCDEAYQPTIYLGNEPENLLGSHYIHRYDFAAKGFVQEGDTYDKSDGTLLKEINIGSFGTVDPFESVTLFNQ